MVVHETVHSRASKPKKILQGKKLVDKKLKTKRQKRQNTKRDRVLSEPIFSHRNNKKIK